MKERIRNALRTAREKILLGLGWLFGVLLILVGLMGILIPPWEPLFGICFLLAGIILLPRLKHWLEPYHIPVNAKTRTVAFLILFAAGGHFGAQAEQRREAQEAVEQREALQEEFNRNPDAILARVETLLADSAYGRAEGLADRYLDAGVTSTELRQLRASAITSQEEARDQEREDSLWATVRQVPASDIYRNRDLYSELVKLDPDNQRYQRKLDEYRSKVAERERRRRQRVAQYGARPEPSAWDGSYETVERFLEPRLHDPGSLEWQGCTEPELIQGEGWRVYCEYRANNAFGAKVLQAAFFTIRRDRVVDMTQTQ